MDVVETKAEGLSRTFEVKVPAAEIQAKLDAKIEEIRPQMKLKGFRPGKVPASHVRKMYGKSLMGELIEGLVGEANQKALDDAEIRPAGQPQIEWNNQVQAVIEEGADLAYQMHVDVMPDFEPADVAEIKIERPTTPVSDAQIDEALSKLAEQNTAYEARGKTAKAREKDAVVIDFVGKVDGEAFEGGSAEGATLVLGSGQFIPGFEDQLVGVKAGEEKAVEVTFPEDYQADHLAGKAAIFDVKVSEVREPKTPDLDDAFAEGLGVASLEELKDILRRQIEGEHAQMSRAKAKRALLDVLDEKHNFDLPPGMVDQEFDQIWSQIEKAKDADQLDDEDKGKSDDELKADYRKIAERRVRLGLVLAEIGTRAEVKISQQDLQQGIIAEARKYPGQEKEIFEFISKNEQAQAQIRAPLYEDKVVDHLLETVSVDDVEVDRETLFKEDDV